MDSDNRTPSKKFAPLDLVAIVLVLLAGDLAGAALVVVWVVVTKTPWRELGFVAPRHWWADVSIGIVAGVLLKLLLKALVLPLLGIGARNEAYQFLVGNTGALPAALAMVVIGGGVGEELVWRGFLFNRLRALIGTWAASESIIVLVTSIGFGLGHLQGQGWPGAIQAMFTGLAFGTAYSKLRRIWPVMVAHAAYDVAAILIIYFNLEEAVAHLVVR